VSSGHWNGAEEAERLILLLYRLDASDCACADKRVSTSVTEDA